MNIQKAVLGSFLVAMAAARVYGGDVPTVKLTQEAADVKVEIDGKPFTTYYFNDGMGKPFVRPFFFPVLSADGTALTSDQSTAKPTAKTPKVDHPHHRSLWISLGDVNGVDHWSVLGKADPANPKEHKGEPAKQVHLKFDKVEGDTIHEQVDWLDYDGKPLLHEARTFKFMGFADGSRGIDFSISLTPAGDAVTIGDTKESGLCAVRVATEIAEKPTITTAEGKIGEKAAWGSKAKWCDESGEIGGKPYGISIFDHPENLRFPTNWHVRAYGLMSANPFGLHDYDKKQPKGAGNLKIESGKTLTFQYRVVFHAGDAASAKLDEKWSAFAGDKK